jgi:hypothetical protein
MSGAPRRSIAEPTPMPTTTGSTTVHQPTGRLVA